MTDLDPLLRDAMARVRRPIDSRPSLTDVRRRARRRDRRRITATVGAVACTGVATAALIVRRDSTLAVPCRLAHRPTRWTSGVHDVPARWCPTTTVYGLSSLTITPRTVWDALWNARYDPSGTGLVVAPADQAAADVMPTPEQFGCTTPECAAMYNYVVWHEIAVQLGFGDVEMMQATNPAIDFSQPPVEGDVLQSVFSSFSDPPPTTSFDGDDARRRSASTKVSC